MAMNPEHLLDTVCRTIDALVESAEPYAGLFPSLLDRDSHTMLDQMPPSIEGQRDGDRAHLGSNLIHDEATLLTMYGLAEALRRPEYAEAADRYLRRFAAHCTDTATGLFPWGEHAFWHLTEDRVGSGQANRNPDFKGSAIHDHLRAAPLWLWEKLHELNPRCVERFGEGLDYHWQEGEPLEYIRHANIEVEKHPKRGERACDFPRHSGFYIFDWAFAYTRTGRADFLEQIQRMVDYWWLKRDARGLLLIESRSPAGGRFHATNAPAQTLSLATSLMESADLLSDREPQLAASMCERARVYIDGFLFAPHDLERGEFLILSETQTNEPLRSAPVWGSVYGQWPASSVASMAVCGYRLTDDSRLLNWAEAVARHYLAEPLPARDGIPAGDAGLALGLLADLYDVTGATSWLDGALACAQPILAAYCDKDLPRGATGIDYYDSQMGPCSLLHALARVALLARDRPSCTLAADYTSR